MDKSDESRSVNEVKVGKLSAALAEGVLSQKNMKTNQSETPSVVPSLMIFFELLMLTTLCRREYAMAL